MYNAGLPMSLCPSLTAQGFGTVVMTRHYAQDSRTVDHITVDHADPHVLVSEDLLNEVAKNLDDADQSPGNPYYAESFRFGLRLESRGYPRICPDSCTYPSHPFCWTDWLLHIDANNRHLVYRLTGYDRERQAWRASWPD